MTVGIICEYNPFHSGHARQLRCIREQAAEQVTVVCLMSGHAVQRGELAIADKFTRADMALACGADLVLELPYPYAAASASYFAGAGVAILDALGIDSLSFGSECADPLRLQRAAEAAEAPAFHAQVAAYQRSGEGSAQAYFHALQELTASDAAFPPNDILALEYVRAIRRLDSDMHPAPLLRHGDAYHQLSLTPGTHPSASALRAVMRRGAFDESLPYMPRAAADILRAAAQQALTPTCPSLLDAAVLAYLRITPPETVARTAEMQGGLAHRLCHAARTAVTVEQLLSLAASKSYPTARLRRALLFAMTGVMPHDLQAPPAYLSLLGANAAGRALLRRMSDTAPIPIVAKFADAAALSSRAARQSGLTQALDALFTLALPTPRPSDFWIKHAPCMR